MNDHGLEKIAKLFKTERAEVFSETAAQGEISRVAIEKDFWVCWALNRIFTDDTLSKQVLFKGGTSLSKCYGLIERFSEDIDLIFDWELIIDEDPYADRSKRQQDLFNKKMEEKACEYVQGTLISQISGLMGDYCQFRIDEEKPRSIMMIYPKSFESLYIKPEVELEMGPMSAMTPNKMFSISPYCSDTVKNVLGDTNFDIRAIEAKKTFWDKITILHVEAHRSENKAQPARYSRHYYDVFQMINAGVGDEALSELDILDDVIKFKNKFYPQGWANYEGARKGEFKLIPEAFRVNDLKKDYAQMEEMIFGDYPNFDVILEVVSEFEKKLKERK